jgi:hypothetical protein
MAIVLSCFHRRSQSAFSLFSPWILKIYLYRSSKYRNSTSLVAMELYDILGAERSETYNKPVGFVTAEDVASHFSTFIAGKTVLITGCSLASLGAQIAWTLAAHDPKLIIITGRSSARLRLLAANLTHRYPGITVRPEVFDLADLSQVRAAAKRINNYQETVDVVVCNAGIMMHPLRKTVDGIESHFGINSTGHFVLVNELLPKMIKNGGGRVVTTTSGAFRFSPVRWDDVNFEVSCCFIADQVDFGR